MSLFADSELVFTCNDKDSTYMGGGYVLKSEFMEGGAPPIFNLKMGSGGDGGNGSGSGDGGNGSGSSDGGNGGNKHRKGRRRRNIKTVSSVLFDGTRAVPAGLFLMNNRRDAHSIYDESQSRINSFLNDSGRSSTNDGNSSSSNDGSNSSTNDGSSSDGSSKKSGGNKSNDNKTKSGGNRHRRRRQSAVVPETLYDTLLKMLAPDADKRRYWANGAKTQRRGHSKNKDNNKNNTRKK